MTLLRQQNTANYPIPLPLWDSAGAPLGSGVTPTITLEKSGGAAAAVAGTITATNAGGTAYLAGNAIDRNTLGSFVLNVSATGAESYKISGAVVAYDPISDAVRGTAGTALPNAVAGMAAGVMVTSSLPDNFSTLKINAFGDVLRVSLTDVVTTVNDKTGYALSSAGVSAVWDAITSGITTANSIGKRLLDFVTGLVYSNPPSAASIATQVDTTLTASHGAGGWSTPTGFSTHSAADVWAVVARTLTAGTNIVLAKGTGITGFTDLDAAGVRSAVGLATANLDTQLIVLGNLDVTVSSRMATFAYTTPPSAAANASEADSVLTIAHGTGSWQTGSGGGSGSTVNVRADFTEVRGT